MIFPIFYFGPISYFQELINAENYEFEIHENFPKQTYRNRCYIQGANGKLRLAIPTQHNGKRAINDIEISYESNWSKEHFKSLVSAYHSSPYFEYYEEDIAAIYDKKDKFLIDFNLRTIEFINSKLSLELNLNQSKSYQIIDKNSDFRNRFDAKSEPLIEMPEYMQVFDEKFGFMPDLSIIDLLCNKGPKSTTYLKEINKINHANE